VINGLGGLTHERKVSLGGQRLGYAMSSGDYMASKFGSQDVVIMHELGHILDFRYKLWDYLTGGAKPGMTGKKAPADPEGAARPGRSPVRGPAAVGARSSTTCA
jgi:hypothetical protein